MELHQVRYFLALCEERSFTRTARRCGISQPSLTGAIFVDFWEVFGLGIVEVLSTEQPVYQKGTTPSLRTPN
jgi:Bacterial regulatory helix-turn-helix protein, lysR family